MKFIKNFSIIAHINHGKSTLADRLIEFCKGLKINSLKNQILDSMDLEREKGITIKSQCVTLNYTINEKNYILNLIDTPGHTDFSYEVSRSLSACNGAILLIDINQGVQAQTLSNYKKALHANLNLILALNKIDLNKIDINKQKKNILSLIEIEENKIFEISAKTGYGMKNLIEGIINFFPNAKNEESNKLEALIIDSWFNNYIGITCLVNIKNGRLKKNDKIITFETKCITKIIDLGIFKPEKEIRNELVAGEIGFININCKNPLEIQIGDTITLLENPSNNKLLSFKKIKPKVYATIYPLESNNFEDLKNAISKLALNDSSIEYTIQKSSIFGLGFRCGFLGILHLEIIQERLEREYNLKIIITPPNVIYKIILKNKEEIFITSPSDMPEMNKIKEIQEPIATINIIAPTQYIGKILELCIENRCTNIKKIYTIDSISIEGEIPLSELIFNFFNKLQTITNGFASLDYTEKNYKTSELVKINILINEKKLDSMEFIIHKSNAYKIGKSLIEKLSKIIPKQLFDIKIQASIDNKIIAKTSIKSMKKNVLSKCYGGDISRKRKLIEKQKDGKKRMKKFGNVEIPQNAFFAILNVNKNE